MDFCQARQAEGTLVEEELVYFRGLFGNKMIFCYRKTMELGFFFKSGILLSLIMAVPTVLGAALVGFKAELRRLSGIGEGIRSTECYCDSFW